MPAHPDNRNSPVIVGGEIETALTFLDYLRHSVVRKLDGLSDDRVRRALVPSGTSLLGLVKHLTQVEVYWLQKRFLGLAVDLDEDSFSVPDEQSNADVLERYAAAWARTDTIAGEADPAQPLARGRQGLTLRWALAHVQQETARHAGHADILREMLDGATGR